jgi:hypothetical protein
MNTVRIEPVKPHIVLVFARMKVTDAQQLERVA